MQEKQHEAQRCVRVVTSRKCVQNLISILIDSTALIKHNVSCAYFYFFQSQNDRHYSRKLRCILPSIMRAT